MSMPLWVSEEASAFWHDARMIEPFPRDLRRAVSRALPVTVVLLPALHVAAVEEWLRRQKEDIGLSIVDRRLRACLVARAGQGIIFIDGADDAAEQRSSLAHELAHFLHDHLLPRRRAERRLGPEALEVIDGERRPRAHEEIRALLAMTPLAAQVHLMERTATGHPATTALDAAEYEADLLAFELLAPADVVLPMVAGLASERRREAVIELLRHQFGLPPGPARHYARLLAPVRPDSPLLRRLKLIT